MEEDEDQVHSKLQENQWLTDGTDKDYLNRVSHGEPEDLGQPGVPQGSGPNYNENAGGQNNFPPLDIATLQIPPEPVFKFENDTPVCLGTGLRVKKIAFVKVQVYKMSFYVPTAEFYQLLEKKGGASA